MMTDEMKTLVRLLLYHYLKKECENVIGIALLLKDKSVFYSSGTLENEQSLCIILSWLSIQSAALVFGNRK